MQQPPTSLPSASVVIPSRGRPERLLGAVQSILDGDEVPAEIIVVDQSDTANAFLAALTTRRPCKLVYRWSPSTGVSRARNAGIVAASHDIVVFTDDDVVVTAEWFGTLVRALTRAGPRTVVTGRVLPDPDQAPDGFVPSLREDVDPAVYTGLIDRDVLYSGNMALFRCAIGEVGAFDERLGPGAPFKSAEDNDLGFRLLEAGYQIEYVPEAALYHLAWRQQRDVLPLYWGYAFGQGAFYAKHANGRGQYVSRRLRRSLKGHAYEIVRAAIREHRFASDHGVYMLGLLAGGTRWLVTQRARVTA